MMKGVDGYAFTSGAKMTDTLIQAGAAKGMTVSGDPASGSATLWNSWGGQIVVAPDTAGEPDLIMGSPLPQTKFRNLPAYPFQQV